MVNVEKFADDLVSLNVTELQQLKKILKDKYGLEETVITVAPAIEEKPVIEEKTNFNVTLKKVSEVTPEKMNTIRLLKEITGLDLKGAKELCDTAPSVVKENTTKADAEGIKVKLEALNATVEIS